MGTHAYINKRICASTSARLELCFLCATPDYYIYVSHSSKCIPARLKVNTAYTTYTHAHTNTHTHAHTNMRTHTVVSCYSSICTSRGAAYTAYTAYTHTQTLTHTSTRTHTVVSCYSCSRRVCVCTRHTLHTHIRTHAKSHSHKHANTHCDELLHQLLARECKVTAYNAYAHPHTRTLTHTQTRAHTMR